MNPEAVQLLQDYFDLIKATDEHGMTDENPEWDRKFQAAMAILRNNPVSARTHEKSPNSAKSWSLIPENGTNAQKREGNMDLVNHPPHYTSHPSGIEAIQVTRHMNFNLGNAMKYLWRAGLKDQSKTIEDLQKAVFYINDEIKRLEATK